MLQVHNKDTNHCFKIAFELIVKTLYRFIGFPCSKVQQNLLKVTNKCYAFGTYSHRQDQQSTMTMIVQLWASFAKMYSPS